MADKTQEKLIEDFANATITVSPKAIERIKNAMKMDCVRVLMVVVVQG